MSRPSRRTFGAWLSQAMVVAVAVTALPAIAQTADVQQVWRQSVPGLAGVMMDIDPANNVFAVGNTISDEVVTRKYSPAGNLLWERVFPGNPDRWLASWISTDPFGNAIVTAHEVTGSNYTPAGWRVFKYDGAGNLLWDDFIQVPLGRTVRVETDAAGNAFVTGTMFLVNSFGSTTIDAVTIKYSPGGTRLWTRVFNDGPSTVDVANSIAVSPDGSRIGVVGRSSTVFFAVVYDAQGNELGRVVRHDLGTARDAVFGTQNDLFVGTSAWTPATSDQMSIVKINAAGNLVFARSYPDGEFVYRMAADSAGNVIAAGVVDIYFDWVTLKIEPDGDRLWSRIYDAHPSNDEEPFFVTTDPTNAVYVTGSGGPPPPQGLSFLQMVTVKYNAGGTQQWVATDVFGFRGVAVRIGTDLAVYVQGIGDMTTIKYDQTDGPPGGSPPAAPSALTVSGTTQTTVSLSWVNNSSTQDGVKIERCPGARCTNFVQVGQVGASATAYVNAGLARRTAYRYRVRAFNEHGNSAYSTVVSAKTTR
jgi:hypothetical protein